MDVKMSKPQTQTWVPVDKAVNDASGMAGFKIERSDVMYMVGRGVVRKKATKGGILVTLEDVIEETRRQARKAVDSKPRRNRSKKADKPNWTQETWGVWEHVKAHPNQVVKVADIAKALSLNSVKVSNCLRTIRSHHNMGRYLHKVGYGLVFYRTISEQEMDRVIAEHNAPPKTNGQEEVPMKPAPEPVINLDQPLAERKAVEAAKGDILLLEKLVELNDGRRIYKDESGVAYWVQRA